MKIKNCKLKIVFVLCSVLFLLFGVMINQTKVFAEPTIQERLKLKDLGDEINKNGKSQLDWGVTDFNQAGIEKTVGQVLIKKIFNIAISVSGVIFMIILLVGGIQYLTGAGNEEATGKAKKMMIDAAIGLLIVLSVWAIGTWVINALAGNSTGSSDDGVAKVDCPSNIISFSVSAQRVGTQNFAAVSDNTSPNIIIKLTNVGDPTETNYKHRVYIGGTEMIPQDMHQRPLTETILYTFDARDGAISYTAKVYKLNTGNSINPLCEGGIRNSNEVPVKP
ncbi:MAG: Uncharacterized protein CEN89_151 [Candidatus Berkelbacteria bacterium Licking1014_7]|uniref:CRIB domain-containing protein n=1 Tax=Candidatus Berkelbacteria bacterium Licking1014_7 TaxID=2017147 RepID=A0A554LK69_9BACT|nr:MAG: Uncharacterized protein CEN89_151 [Candidatus Berkelbacteria bacterium Licking1014_7]